jgi:hypothetical protein
MIKLISLENMMITQGECSKQNFKEIHAQLKNHDDRFENYDNFMKQLACQKANQCNN